MSDAKFVYVTYIRTTPEKLWAALTDPEFCKQYWFGMHQECGWTKGAPWTMRFPDGQVADTGEVVEIAPPSRLVLKWRNEFRPELKAEGYTLCSFAIEQDGEMTRLTVTHEAENANKMLEAVSQGWPKVLSSLKSLLESGAGLPSPERFDCRQSAA